MYKKIFSLLGIIGILTLFLGSIYSPSTSYYETISNSYLAILNNIDDDIIYMSDLDYITADNWSYNGWANHSIEKDKNPDGGTISLLIDNKKKIFVKGMGIHADGQVTYDISNISSEYTRFITYAGVDSSKNQHGSVIFNFLVSNDGVNWNNLYTTNIQKGNNNASKIDIDISNYKYLRVYVNKSIDGNSYDHGVLGSAKFVKNNYVDNTLEYTGLKDISYYDNILKKYDIEYNLNNNYELILKRELVNKLNIDVINSLVNYSSKYKELFDYIISDKTIMEYIIEVGDVNSLPFLKVLEDLYRNNIDIFNSQDSLVYKKMIISLAASYSTDTVASALEFSHKYATYDYLERFNIYKELLDSGKFTVYGEYFKNYHVSLMRLVMSDGARNDELKWLNYYTSIVKKNNQSVYAYVRHTEKGVGYNDSIYHDLIYKEEQDSKYNLSNYGVPFGDSYNRYWMVIDKGGICWNQSRVFKSLFDSIGSPTTGSYQPSHEVTLFYVPTSLTTGRWDMANNIFGYGKTGTSWYGGNRFRTIFDWANKSFTNQIISGNNTGNNSGYIYLEQDNLNNYDKYKKSLYINLLANSYNDYSKKIDIYKSSIIENNINLDTYVNLIDIYKLDENTKESDWHNLALSIIDNFTYYPNALNDLLKLIEVNLTNELRINIDNLENNALIKASKATSSQVSHSKACNEIASVILGKENNKMAEFSFDGDNKNKIVFNEMYKDYDISWSYSLDGGITRSNKILDKSYELSQEEINKINENNDILIYLDGLDVNTPSYTIDIEKKETPAYLYNNDLENKVIGATAMMEWRYSGSNTWVEFRYQEPVLEGDASVDVRYMASKNLLASDYVSLTYTKDIEDLTKKYVPISYLNIHEVSSEATGSGQNGWAIYAIDGNYHTRWHSNWNGTDSERFITIKFNESIYLSKIDFVPANGGNGRIIDGLIEGSVDGINWTTLYTIKDLTYTGNVNDYDFGLNNIKSFEIDFSNQISYVRITSTKSSGGDWFAARMFNFYQDSTKTTKPKASVKYDNTNKTNKNVLATLVDYDKDKVEVLSDITHEFTTNGEYSFIIKDKFTGLTNTIIAKVDWIDKEAPIGKVTYDINSYTNNFVTATLTTNEPVTILNNGSNKYTFGENGEYIFEYVDEAGNYGSTRAYVDWIDRTTPVGKLTYKTINNTVVVEITFNKDNVTILNNFGLNYYKFTSNGKFIFKYVDKYGNYGLTESKVDWLNNITNNNSNNNSNNIKDNNSLDSSSKKDNPSTENKNITNSIKENNNTKENNSYKDYLYIMIILIVLLIIAIVRIVYKRK